MAQQRLMQRLGWVLLRSSSGEWRSAAERWLQQAGVPHVQPPAPASAAAAAARAVPLAGYGRRLSSQPLRDGTAENSFETDSIDQQQQHHNHHNYQQPQGGPLHGAESAHPPPHAAAAPGAAAPGAAARHAHVQAATDAALSAFASGQQRVLLRIPRGGEWAPIAAEAAARAAAGGGRAAVLADGAARADEAAAALAAALPPGAGVARVPGLPLRQSDAAAVVDLRRLALDPRAAWQLRRRQHQDRFVLAVLDEPLECFPPAELARAAQGQSGGGAGAGGGAGGGGDGDALAAAAALLHDLGFMAASLDKRLLTLSARWWEALLAPPGGFADAVAPLQRVAWQMAPEDAAAAGLLAPVAAAAVETGVTLDAALLSGGGAAAALEAALCEPRRVGAVAEAYARLCPSARALALAAGPRHARALAVALAMRGVPAVPLHSDQAPPEAAAVLASFASGGERVLVAAGAAAERLPLGAAPLEALLVAAPVVGRGEYLARVAPALAARGGGGGGGGGGEGRPCLVIDFSDDWQHAGGAGSGGGAGGAAPLRPVFCRDALPAALVAAPAPAAPPEAAAEAAPAAEAAEAAAAAVAEPPTTGQLEWVVLDDGSWAMPLTRARTSLGSAMTGAAASAAARAGPGRPASLSAAAAAAAGAIRIVRLRRTKKGAFVPEIVAGGGEAEALAPNRRMGMRLQAARTFAEHWVAEHDPSTYAMHELGSEWKNHPATDAQLAFCLRHGIAHDASWTKGQARRAMDRYIVQEMRVPASEEQLRLLRHLGPFLPPIARGSRAFLHARAAAVAIESALTGGAAAPGTAPLPARVALVADLKRLWAVGVVPRFDWIGVNAEGDLVLDLMSGSYVWLTRLRPGAEPGAAAPRRAPRARQGAARADGANGAAEGGGGEGGEGGGSGGSGGGGGGAEGSGGSGGGIDPSSWPPLDPSAAYVATLQLPSGRHVPLTSSTVAEPGLFAPLEPDRPLSVRVRAAAGGGGGGGDGEGGDEGEDSGGGGGAAGGAGGGARRVRSFSRAGTPLTTALARAELVAARLQVVGVAFINPKHVARIVSAVGGWKVAAAHDGFAHHLTPAGARQLEALRAAGLPASRRYTALDAARELMRASKARGAPEAPATPAQLARIEELGLGDAAALDCGRARGASDGGGGAGAAGGLTYAQARALLFKAALQRDAEAAEAAAAGLVPRGGRRPGEGARGRGSGRGMSVARLMRQGEKAGQRLRVPHDSGSVDVLAGEGARVRAPEPSAGWQSQWEAAAAAGAAGAGAPDAADGEVRRRWGGAADGERRRRDDGPPGLRLFLDSADVRLWRAYAPTGTLWGVTTNPAILERDGVPCSLRGAAGLVQEARTLGLGEFQFQAWGASASDLLASALAILDLGSPADDLRLTVKLPCTAAGLEAAARLRAERPGASVTVTGVYAAHQCLLAAGVGADYVAPYLGRMGDAAGAEAALAEVASMQAAMAALSARGAPRTRVLVASIRDPSQMARLAAAGCDTFTYSPAIMEAMLGVPATLAAVADFDAAAARNSL
ncbi:transaldolase [Raphidocelis subcapitata]|uniref:Transaldolase n=1 Tax=Raphidocelis subcapitata TaxID=307507 RepID=A0A2V0PAY0_9CHLO|nr:transaldolase [Raphidocelis subcapitata]|eukprot:GBF96092.1 transaldolase [Raphidocelis subcapitata]